MKTESKFITVRNDIEIIFNLNINEPMKNTWERQIITTHLSTKDNSS
tara:strand:- start:735 stop:875 length:141 start_codon:yes stop_codon:yes gene_type:complete